MSGPGWEDADRCARMRSRVQQLVKSRWADGLELAREIPLPWYRVQALCAVASAADDGRVDGILKEAVKQAEGDADAYRRIAVVTWVIGAAASRNRVALAKRLLREAMARSGAITPLKSRASAIELLLAQAASIGEMEARQVADALLDAAAILSKDPEKRWRKWGTSFVNRTAGILSKEHASLARDLLSARFGAESANAILARHSASSVR